MAQPLQLIDRMTCGRTKGHRNRSPLAACLRYMMALLIVFSLIGSAGQRQVMIEHSHDDANETSMVFEHHDLDHSDDEHHHPEGDGGEHHHHLLASGVGAIAVENYAVERLFPVATRSFSVGAREVQPEGPVFEVIKPPQEGC